MKTLLNTWCSHNTAEQDGCLPSTEFRRGTQPEACTTRGPVLHWLRMHPLISHTQRHKMNTASKLVPLYTTMALLPHGIIARQPRQTRSESATEPPSPRPTRYRVTQWQSHTNTLTHACNTQTDLKYALSVANVSTTLIDWCFPDIGGTVEPKRYSAVSMPSASGSSHHLPFPKTPLP